jgi:radical SAM protein (TIGR01212 family)
MLYNNLSGYLREKYGKRLGKICIDGGFSCPNRDGRVGRGGCLFCSERGSGEHIEAGKDIREQVIRALGRDAYDGYIAYFQNYTNTYAPIPVLKERYDAALIDERIKILAIGTRPDCIGEEVARLIASYRDKVDVWVELGLQSSSDRTARIINRGYESEAFLRATEILRAHGIPVVAHMIIGLPGEGESEVLETVDFLNRAGVFGVKIHSLYVAEGTALEKIYREGGYIPIELSEYARICAGVIARLSPDIIIHRVTGDCPRELLVAPMWNIDKNRIIDEINCALTRNGLRQGSLYKPELM